VAGGLIPIQSGRKFPRSCAHTAALVGGGDLLQEVRENIVALTANLKRNLQIIFRKYNQFFLLFLSLSSQLISSCAVFAQQERRKETRK
jgi:hypothetical protein